MIDADTMIKLLPQRFREKFVPDQTNGCWLWKGSIDKDGYGRFWWDGQTGPAHRFAWQSFYGRIVCGLQIDHRCKVRQCVNPEHLELVTNFENSRRGRSWTFKSEQTYCKHGHSLCGDNLIIEHQPGRTSSRRCRACKNERRKTVRYKEVRNARARERYANDADYKAKVDAHNREYQRTHREERNEYVYDWKRRAHIK